MDKGGLVCCSPWGRKESDIRHDQATELEETANQEGKRAHREVNGGDSQGDSGGDGELEDQRIPWTEEPGRPQSQRAGHD